ncbi:MAG: DUF2975 domain-containing protein [Eggerthellaceae bacterium]|nr:DUF2975 domain-containing protein [Eggerthellaceae bacterium]
MKQKEISSMLKALAVVSVVACLALMFVALPLLARTYLDSLQASALYWPFLAVSWVGLAPLVAIAAIAWSIFTEIGRDNSFCEKNASRLRLMSYISTFCIAVWLAGVLFIALSGAAAMGILLAFTVAMALMIFMAVVCACLSHLTAKAALIKQENDLTV